MARGMNASKWGILAFSFLMSSAGPAAAIQDNVIKSIKSVTTPEAGVEIELHSTKPFPVRNQIVVLRIGAKEFTRSRPPDDGSLTTLIFILSLDEFSQTKDGDQMIVQYGHGQSGSDKRDYGALDKSMLDQQEH